METSLPRYATSILVVEQEKKIRPFIFSTRNETPQKD